MIPKQVPIRVPIRALLLVNRAMHTGGMAIIMPLKKPVITAMTTVAALVRTKTRQKMTIPLIAAAGEIKLNTPILSER